MSVTITSLDTNNSDGRHLNYQEVQVQAEALEEGYIINLSNYM